MARPEPAVWSPGGSTLVLSGHRAQGMTGNVRFPGCTDRHKLPTMVEERAFGERQVNLPSVKEDEMVRSTERSAWHRHAGKLLAGVALVIGPVAAWSTPAFGQMPTCLRLPA